MNYFKDKNDEIFAYDNEQIEQGYGKDLIAITEDEKDKLLYKEPTVEEIKQSIENAIQAMVDNQARELGYDNIVSACSYAGYPNEFQDEALKLGQWRSAVWTKAFEIQNSLDTVPTVDEVLEQLPKYEGDK